MTDEILYVKGMNMSESEAGEDGDEWDDRKLNDAYDKALRIANAEVAKRVAMSTNTKEGGKGGNSKPKKDNKEPPKQGSLKKKPVSTNNSQWKAGMPCRAIYEEDGMEYEAFVLRIINDNECVVRFLGYENSEIVDISTLKPTLGNDERTRQIEQVLLDKGEDNYSQTHSNVEQMDFSDRVATPETDHSSQRKKSSKKKKNKNSSRNFGGFELPDLPPMPNIAMMRNQGTMDMPMPPPPLAFTSSVRSESEDQALSSMLLSWYMSGYYTGLYQGMKRAKEGRRNM